MEASSSRFNYRPWRYISNSTSGVGNTHTQKRFETQAEKQTGKSLFETSSKLQLLRKPSTTHVLEVGVPSLEENGNKIANEYVRECKIGAGSYGKVVLYRNQVDRKRYAIKVIHQSQVDGKHYAIKVDIFEPKMTNIDIRRLILGCYERNRPCIAKCHQLGVKEVLVKLGDTFTAAYAVAFVEGKSKVECLKFADASMFGKL
ncbi:hypothetical protein L2E82_32092 [Cichorium intybus]|uniref:Uncharacterized protein n=1 Tax=Cichorium intybus TaxID=13427 RepID=A0ACB9BGL2_CICIN|nr:hypothetical protein L2E82_32092 [Cichorium intybus]